MYHVSAQGIDERMINVHYYYYYFVFKSLFYGELVQWLEKRIGVFCSTRFKEEFGAQVCTCRSEGIAVWSDLPPLSIYTHVLLTSLSIHITCAADVTHHRKGVRYLLTSFITDKMFCICWHNSSQTRCPVPDEIVHHRQYFLYLLTSLITDKMFCIYWHNSSQTRCPVPDEIVHHTQYFLYLLTSLTTDKVFYICWHHSSQTTCPVPANVTHHTQCVLYLLTSLTIHNVSCTY